MKRFLLLLAAAAFLGACTTTETIVDRVEVPVPYWNPPENVQKLPERAPLESKRITPEMASEDTQAAFRALAEDIRALIEENELIRFYYQELVTLISGGPP
jgi:PBP1b-binding outer membrane lipoprotein LpoB